MRGLRYAWVMTVPAVVGMVATAGRAGVSRTGDTYDDGLHFYGGYNANTTGGLTIDAGSVFGFPKGYLGYATGSTATALITGVGSQWKNTHDLYVGYNGSGTFQVEAGGKVKGGSASYSYLGYNPGSTGEAIITGAGSKWTNSDYLHVGFSGSSTLRIEAEGQVSDYGGSLGYHSGSTGTATITGAGSKWINSGDLYVGYSGRATLKVEAGGQVSNTDGYLGYTSGSTGVATVTGAGSRWANSGELYVGWSGSGKLTVSDGGMVSAKMLYASLSGLYGDGLIAVQSGGVLDADLVFDAAHDSTQTTVAFGSGGTLQFTVDGKSDLGVGYKHSGSLRVADGRLIASTAGFLGLRSGSTGTALVTGAGSKWTNTRGLYVGNSGSGSLRVEAGGQVSNSYGCLGRYSGCTGTAVITGAGSEWTNSGSLAVGIDGSGIVGGSGKLMVSDGGQVTTGSLSIGGQSAVRLHVSGDRMLVLGDASNVGSIFNNAGRLSLLADAFLPSGSYRPVGEYADRAVRWSGSGSTVAVGGVWDGGAGTFVVSDPVLVEAGVAAEVSGGMRMVIGGGEERVGVSLGELSSGGELTGWALTQEERAGLLAGLGEGERIAGAWEFEGELAGGEALVSMEAGVGAEEVRVWRREEGQWSEYRPEMLTYDGKGVVSFTVEAGSLNSGAYAVSVPEPGLMSLLVVGAGMMVGGRHGRGAGECEAVFRRE